MVIQTPTIPYQNRILALCYCMGEMMSRGYPGTIVCICGDEQCKVSIERQRITVFFTYAEIMERHHDVRALPYCREAKQYHEHLPTAHLIDDVTNCLYNEILQFSHHSLARIPQIVHDKDGDKQMFVVSFSRIPRNNSSFYTCNVTCI